MLRRRPVLRRPRRDRFLVHEESQSLTGRVVESLIKGISPITREEPPIPGAEGRLICMGDPDVNALRNEYAGDESPGASTPTPDQNLIDAVGHAYGVENEGGGSLRTSSELLDRRDGHAALRKPRERQRH